jgi:hypothetical protein
MTDTNNEWIEQAFMKFCLLSEIKSNYAYNKYFKKAIEDNLPQSISREAVEKLREKYIKINNDKDHDFYGALDELLSELDDLLLTSKDNDSD